MRRVLEFLLNNCLLIFVYPIVLIYGVVLAYDIWDSFRDEDKSLEHMNRAVNASCMDDPKSRKTIFREVLAAYDEDPRSMEYLRWLLDPASRQ